MKNLMENLVALQNLQFQTGRRPPEAEQRIEALRKKVSEPLLTRFDRLLARGRKAVAVVHNGVCGECHLKLAVGIVGALAFGEEIQYCDNCGRSLYPPEDKPLFATARPVPVKTKPSRAAGRKEEAPFRAR